MGNSIGIGAAPTPIPRNNFSYTPQTTGGQSYPYTPVPNSSYNGVSFGPNGQVVMTPYSGSTPINTGAKTVTPINTGAKTVTPISSNPSTDSGFDMKYYPGWNYTEALADWRATGGSKAHNNQNQGGGTNPPPQSKYLSLTGDKRADIVANDPVAQQDFENSGLNMDEYLASIDNEYNTSNDYLNTAESNINADRTSTLANLEKQRGALKEQSYNKKEDAQTAARRLYSELQQGYRQRFGGASSAGEAAMALTNNEQQRQMATNNRSYQDSLVQIDMSADSAIASAQTEFRNILAQITQNRTLLVSRKEQAKRQALQKLSDQVFQVQQQRQTLKDNITLMQEQARINNANNLSRLTNNPGSNLGFGDGTTKYASGNNSNSNLLGATGIASFGGNIRYTDGTIRDQYGNIIR